MREFPKAARPFSSLTIVVGNGNLFGESPDEYIPDSTSENTLVLLYSLGDNGNLYSVGFKRLRPPLFNSQKVTIESLSRSINALALVKDHCFVVVKIPERDTKLANFKTILQTIQHLQKLETTISKFEKFQFVAKLKQEKDFRIIHHPTEDKEVVYKKGTAIEKLATQVSDEPVVQNEIWDQVDLRKVTEIDLPSSVLHGNWRQGKCFRVNDLADLSNIPISKREGAKNVAEQLTPIGVRSFALYTLTNTDSKVNTVSVVLFVFEDAAQCKSWWKVKYKTTDWEQYYVKVESDSAIVLEGIGADGIAMAFGNVLLTADQSGEGEEHITAANHVLKLLTNGAKTVPRVKIGAEAKN